MKYSQSDAELYAIAQLLRATRCCNSLQFHNRCSRHTYKHDPLYYREILKLLHRRFQVQAKYAVFSKFFSRAIPQYRQKSAKGVCKRKNNHGNRFLMLKNHSVDTLHDLLGQNTENKNIAILRSAARLCAAAARYTVLRFLGIPYQVFWTLIRT